MHPRTATLLAISLLALGTRAEAVDLLPGDYLITDFFSNSLLRIEPATGAATVVATGFTQPRDVAINASGDVYVLNGFSGGILQVDPVTGSKTIVASGGYLQQVTSISITPDGDLLATDLDPSIPADEARGRVIRVDPQTGAQTLMSSGGFLLTVLDAQVDAIGDIVVLTDGASFGPLIDDPAIIEVNSLTGAQNVLAPWISGQPRSMNFGPDGYLYVGDTSSGLYKVNPGSGEIALIAPRDGPGFTANAEDFAFDANGDIVGVSLSGGVYRLDLVTETKTIVVPSSGFPPEAPTGIAIIPVNGPCANGVDDDGDGFMDYPADLGCSNAADLSELSNLACDNGLDDDNDGTIDWRGDGTGDPDCQSLSDKSEQPSPPPGCGFGPELVPVLLLLGIARRRSRVAA